jgi:adenylate cyclase
MKVSLLGAILLSSLSVLVGTVAVVGGSAWWTGRTAVTELSDQLLHQADERVQERVEALLHTAARQAEAAAGLPFPQKGADLTTVLSRLRALFAANPELTYLSVSLDQTGEYGHVFRRPDGKLEEQECRRESSGKVTRTDWVLDTAGKRVLRDTRATDYDPRKRPFYALAKSAGRAAWSDSYAFPMPDGSTAVGITCALPVYDEKRKLIGVLSADLTLSALSGFLRTVKLGESGYAFVVERRADGIRKVIAHPEAKLLDTDATKNPRLSALLSEIRLGERTPKTQTARSERADLGVCRRLDGENYPRWLVCAVVPEREITARIDRNARLGAVASLGGVVLGILGSIALALRIARPLRQIARETEAIKNLELAAKKPPATGLTEVAELGGAVEQMKTNLRSFAKFVPREYVATLIAEGVEARLSGVRKSVTVGFMDFVGFSAIAETSAPEPMVAILGEALGLMAEATLSHNGTVDKFIGDELMAFWDEQDHAISAVRAALAIQTKLASERERWKAEGRPQLWARIGLNSGEAVIGTMGCELRYSLTAIGDAVNLGKRIESLNKKFGTQILVTDETRQLTEGEFLMRPVAKVSVAGRATPTLVWEPLAAKSEATEPQKTLAGLAQSAMDAYLSRDFPAAEAALQKILATRPDDGPALYLLARCHIARATPPEDGWDGTDQLTEK